MEADYVLVNHPYPSLEGELLIYQYPEPKTLDSTDQLDYKDFSLKKRLKTRNNNKAALAARKKHDEDSLLYTKLQCLEVDNREPLSTIDWDNMA